MLVDKAVKSHEFKYNYIIEFDIIKLMELAPSQTIGENMASCRGDKHNM